MLSRAIPRKTGALALGGALLTLSTIAGFQAMSHAQSGESDRAETAEAAPGPAAPGADDARLQTATFGGGCFWCTEAVFVRLRGVRSVVSGYSGGHVKDPTYKQVCSGRTGHAEVVQVSFDPGQIAYADLLEVFWATHDPTTLNRQGADVGTQYRSVVFYHDEAQRKTAEEMKRKLDASGELPGPVVTEIAPFRAFYAAEDYHQDYFAQNPRKPYCTTVISPKVKKFEKSFRAKLKEESAGTAPAGKP